MHAQVPVQQIESGHAICQCEKQSGYQCTHTLPDGRRIGAGMKVWTQEQEPKRQCGCQPRFFIIQPFEQMARDRYYQDRQGQRPRDALATPEVLCQHQQSKTRQGCCKVTALADGQWRKLSQQPEPVCERRRDRRKTINRTHQAGQQCYDAHAPDIPMTLYPYDDVHLRSCRTVCDGSCMILRPAQPSHSITLPTCPSATSARVLCSTINLVKLSGGA